MRERRRRIIRQKIKNTVKHCKGNTRIKGNRVLINQNKLRKTLQTTEEKSWNTHIKLR